MDILEQLKEEINILIGPEPRIQALLNALEYELSVLKPHPDYDFVNHDQVFVENSDGSVEFFELMYEPETSDWVLLPFTDKYFTEFDESREVELLSSYGYDIIERMEGINLDEFD